MNTNAALVRVVDTHDAVAGALLAALVAPPVPQDYGGQDDENLHCDLQRNPDD